MTIDGQSGGGSKIAKKVMTSYMTAPLKKVRPLIGLDRVLCSSIINILNILIEYLGLVENKHLPNSGPLALVNVHSYHGPLFELVLHFTIVRLKWYSIIFPLSPSLRAYLIGMYLDSMGIPCP